MQISIPICEHLDVSGLLKNGLCFSRLSDGNEQKFIWSLQMANGYETLSLKNTPKDPSARNPVQPVFIGDDPGSFISH
ncbi:MAG: hypothetical protein LBB16_01520 [Puniceicoccales bacterium]|jgi:hypothetical protein|nr:hypothetical protein [Puniceicoccales bacterium]